MAHRSGQATRANSACIQSELLGSRPAQLQLDTYKALGSNPMPFVFGWRIRTRPSTRQNGSFVSLNRKLDGDKRCDGRFFSFDLQFGFERSRDTIAAKVFEVRSDFDGVVGSFPRLCGFESPNRFAI